MLVLHNFFENQFSVFSFFQIILRNTILKGTSLACFISENRLEEIMAFVTKWHTKMVYKYCEGCLLEHYWSSKSLCDEQSSRFSISSDIHQGCPFSPFLSNFIIDIVFEEMVSYCNFLWIDSIIELNSNARMFEMPFCSPKCNIFLHDWSDSVI